MLKENVYKILVLSQSEKYETTCNTKTKIL